MDCDGTGLQVRIPTTLSQGTDAESSYAAIAPAVEWWKLAFRSLVAITCFGEYRIAVDGETSTLAPLRPQARWVLQILSLSPDRDHHREFLEDILWPGVDHSVACHRLQVAVSSVRTMFGGVKWSSAGGANRIGSVCLLGRRRCP